MDPKRFAERYEQLNAAQKQAVDALEGPVMVIAGPGSGKTELLALRVGNILASADVSPGNILCLTFTDAAAFNMRRRLAELIGRDAYRVSIHTFHSFGVEIIGRYPEHFYNGAFLSPADELTQITVLEAIMSGLEHGDPLRAELNGQFTYLNKVREAIGHMKKAGISPGDLRGIVEESRRLLPEIDAIVSEAFASRISKSSYGKAHEAVEALRALQAASLPEPFLPLPEALARSLTEALLDAEASETMKPLTEWKRRHTAKDDAGQTRVRELVHLPKMESLSRVYGAYAENMRKEEYYDYDDMILDTISTLVKNPGARLDLQERYHYVLVDEFQDTNEAQMRLLALLTENPVNEGRPNIMVVGDDDQAIYKFQGAEISNIVSFAERYRDPKLIVLSQSYRSSQRLLDAARSVIQRGSLQLQKLLPELRKELSSAAGEGALDEIRAREFPSEETQYHWLAAEAKRLIEGGTPAGKIAVIGRRHRDLEALVPHFHAAEVPVSYERQRNVLHEPHVRQLVTMMRFVDSLASRKGEEDAYLAEILHYPFWGLDRKAVWEISLSASSSSWLLAMERAGGKASAIADFFIELGGRAQYETAEEILHELVGGPQRIFSDEDGDGDTFVRSDMFSPFRSYYFSRERFHGKRADYIQFLSSLQSFIDALREYRRGRPLKVRDAVEFIELYEKNQIPIHNASPFMNAPAAVQFLTAHKSKGLEFDTVFVLNCQEDVWANSRAGRRFPMPSNLPIAPSEDSMDDEIRLFYVAMTRARKHLYLTSYRADSRGRESLRLSFLTPREGVDHFKPEFLPLQDFAGEAEKILNREWEARRAGPFMPDEQALLAPFLEEYQLNVTHLHNFLDVRDGGPLAFFEKNLLRFPEPKTASGSYGSAVHQALQRAHDSMKKNGAAPDADAVVRLFTEFLRRERLSERDFEHMRLRGERMLPPFYESVRESFSPGDFVEFNFKRQGVIVNGIPISGKVDHIAFSRAGIAVRDWKTGKPLRRWDPADPYEKVKAWKYRGQIVFYKLLIEHSREFMGKGPVREGCLEFVEAAEDIRRLPVVIEPAETERMERLIAAVYRRIMALDFPDISRYAKDMNGIRAFEEDLLAGS
jgi:DNA helicase-2/ATP-dependent DNA helicase PcrA